MYKTKDIQTLCEGSYDDTADIIFAKVMWKNFFDVPKHIWSDTDCTLFSCNLLLYTFCSLSATPFVSELCGMLLH